MSLLFNFELSARQISILSEITQGFCNNEIAEHLGISIRTVEDHRSKMLKKSRCKNMAELTVCAIKKGYIII